MLEVLKGHFYICMQEFYMVRGAKGLEDVLSWISASVSTASVFSFWSELISPSHSVSIHEHLCTCECAFVIIWQARGRVFMSDGLLLCAENWPVGFNHYKVKGKNVKLSLCLTH